MSQEALCECGKRAGTNTDECMTCRFVCTETLLRREVEELRGEVARLREGEWSYDSLTRILRDELPLTMTLGLAVILVERMVVERMFAEQAEGVVDILRKTALKAYAQMRAAEAEGGP